MSPREVDRLSFWELLAMSGGAAKSRNPDGAKQINTEEAQRLAAFLDEPPIWH